MSKITPGIWEVFGTGEVAVYNAKERKMPKIVCDCERGEITDEHIKEIQANARLVAYAPEMYNQLHVLLAYVYSEFNRLDDMEPKSPKCAKAKKDIAQTEALLKAINIEDDGDE